LLVLLLVLVLLVLLAVAMLVVTLVLVLVRQPYKPGVMRWQVQLAGQWWAPWLPVPLLVLLCQHNRKQLQQAVSQLRLHLLPCVMQLLGARRQQRCQQLGCGQPSALLQQAAKHFLLLLLLMAGCCYLLLMAQQTAL
jgi:hypothetical protein